MPLKIIVNADDLGMNEAVNDAIFRGMAKGVITSSTMLSNGPAAKCSLQKLESFPHCSIGIHLNLTEFEPVCPASYQTLASVMDENGHFNGNAIRNVRITPRMLRAIYREWCAQIEKVMSWGIKPSHIDSHHHVHTIPQLLPVLRALRRRYGIRKVRISRNYYVDSSRPSAWILAAKKLYNFSLHRVGFHTTEVFTDLETFHKQCAVHPPRCQTIELMVHPGAPDNPAEADLLSSNWFQALEYRSSAINYQQL